MERPSGQIDPSSVLPARATRPRITTRRTVTYPSTALRAFEGKLTVGGLAAIAVPLVGDLVSEGHLSENVQLALIASATILLGTFNLSRGMKVKEYRGPYPDSDA